MYTYIITNKFIKKCRVDMKIGGKNQKMVINQIPMRIYYKITEYSYVQRERGKVREKENTSWWGQKSMEIANWRAVVRILRWLAVEVADLRW